MKKLRLDLSDVDVVTFEIPADVDHAGTVQAHDDSEGVSFCGVSCAWTCGGGGPSLCDPYTNTGTGC